MKVLSDVNVTALNVYRNEAMEKAKDATAQDGTKQSKVTNGTDRVELSLNQSTVEQLKSALATSTDDPVRQQRVAELKQLVASGNYQVSGRQVAEKMVSQMRAMSAGGAGNEG